MPEENIILYELISCRKIKLAWMYIVGRCGAQMLSVFQSGPGREEGMNGYL